MPEEGMSPQEAARRERERRRAAQRAQGQNPAPPRPARSDERIFGQNDRPNHVNMAQLRAAERARTGTPQPRASTSTAGPSSYRPAQRPTAGTMDFSTNEGIQNAFNSMDPAYRPSRHAVESDTSAQAEHSALTDPVPGYTVRRSDSQAPSYRTAPSVASSHSSNSSGTNGHSSGGSDSRPTRGGGSGSGSSGSVYSQSSGQSAGSARSGGTTQNAQTSATRPARSGTSGGSSAHSSTRR